MWGSNSEEMQWTPSVEPRAGPSVEPRAGPSIEHRAGPSVEHRAGPSVVSIAGPSFKHGAGPRIMFIAGPSFKRRAGPSIEYRAGPSVEHRAGPSVVSIADPSFQRRAGPSIEHRAGPSDKYRAEFKVVPSVEPMTGISETNNLTSCDIFIGVVAFVDYKCDQDPSNVFIQEHISDLGATIAKTFNRKVTHVIFRYGSRRTYEVANTRNVPLVSMGWVIDSMLTKKMANTADHPPEDIIKYTNKEYTPEQECNYARYQRYSQDINDTRESLRERSTFGDISIIPQFIEDSVALENNLRQQIAIDAAQTHENNINLMSRDSSSNSQSHTCSQGVAFTGFTTIQEKYLKIVMKTLGFCTFHKKVQSKTTFLLFPSNPHMPDHTLNMVFAMAHGCYIVSDNWIEDSNGIGKLLHHENYLKSDLSDPVKEFQVLHNTVSHKTILSLFHNVGKICISKTCEPNVNNLKRLVGLCGGKCIDVERSADVVVGKTPNTKYRIIHENWILQSITCGRLLSMYAF